MTKFLLAVHVLAAIVAIGPVTVAASMFPPAVRRALAAPEDLHREGHAVLLRLIRGGCPCGCPSADALAAALGGRLPR
ncbi:hypothetical protein [Streptomyces sp. NPDC001292]|uniref:hypothetical protein n=1 Tax=Streptomyces sp. NPDC001292 TaxID=3364558 RepID=UPI003679A5BA